MTAEQVLNHLLPAVAGVKPNLIVKVEQKEIREHQTCFLEKLSNQSGGVYTHCMSEEMQEGQQVITACAFIYHNFGGTNKVFSAKRAETKKFLPGRWELPGGHIDFGEDIVEGLKREMKEEFGMEIQVDEPFAVFTYINEIKKTHSIEVIYLARFISDISSVKLNPEDHSEYGWFDEKDAHEVIFKSKPADDPEITAVARGFRLLALTRE